MSEKVNIQWFPGHMAKTRRLIKENLHLVDCVAEIIDARIPTSSRNPEINSLCGTKPRVVVLNKSDLADPSVTELWVKMMKSDGVTPIAADCKSGRGLNGFLPAVKYLIREKIAENVRKGMAGRKIRIMVAGIPNCGKSTFINKMSGSKGLKTEDRPGVTRANQWITIGGKIEMMDTPGILWPKFDDPETGENLAFCGAVKDEVVDSELIAFRFLEKAALLYPEYLKARYKLSGELPSGGEELLSLIGRKRGMLVSGGEIDTYRAAAVVLDEFRSGKIGRISLERP